MKKNTKILPPTYLYICLIVEVVSHFLYPIKRIIPSPTNLTGILIIVFGIVLNLWADNLFKKKKTTVKPFEKPSAFIISGPFGFSRHPMYLGFIFLLLGLAILLGSLTPFLPPIVLFIILQKLFISQEEKNLKQTFANNMKIIKER